MNRSQTMVRSQVVALTAVAAMWIFSAQAETAGQTHAHEHEMQGAQDASGTDGRPGKASDVTRTVRLDAGDKVFNVKRIRVKAGETVRFVVTSKSSIPHEFVIASRDEHLEHRKMMQQMAGMKMEDEPNAITIDPGQTKELIWKFGKDKDVEFACDIPGHAEQGMAGVFQVVK